MPERCGLRFKKPVDQISDRAKRYRAHQPGCRPKGAKVCFKCGSRRFVVPDHIDGDESNGRASNLRWTCKSHNTILGKKMAKAGKGVRTRQYNPKRSTKKQLVAELNRIRKEPPSPSSNRRHEEILQLLRKNPGATNITVELARLQKLADRAALRGDAKTFQRYKRQILKLLETETKEKNPAASNLAQYVQAAVEHTRGAHDAGGKVIHETPKAKRKAFAREIAFRKGYRSNPKRRNPDDDAEADALYKKFHGRGPSSVYNAMVKGIDPYAGHPALASLGPLVRLVVGIEVEFNREGAITDEGDIGATELTFVPMAQYRRITETMDPKNPQEVRELKAWMKKAGAPDVAGVPPNGKQLFFVGGNQKLDDSMLRKLGCDPEKDFCDLGDCCLIEYFAQKKFDKYELMTYYHEFGEDTGTRPRLFYRKNPGMLELAGGEYVVLASGINN